MKTINQWFDEYAVSHQNTTNKAVHYICVPLIFFSIVALLASIPSTSIFPFASPALVPYLHFGTVLIGIGLLFYIRLSLPIFIGIAVFSLICLYRIIYLKAGPCPLWSSSLLIFVLAWISQLIGHHMESENPYFLKDLQFLLIGPAWILGFVDRNLGIKY